MIKTDKYNRMLSAFQCDFSLAKDGNHRMTELDGLIKSGNKKLLADIELLEELQWKLRHGLAEIHVKEE